MKKTVLTLLVLLLACLLLAGCGKRQSNDQVQAQAESPATVLTFTLNEDGDSYAVTGVSHAKGTVEIPSSYKDLPVTEIGDGAFVNCTNMTGVTIPDSVTKIGVEAFVNCTGLTSVTIGNGVVLIADAAFANCTGLTSITIPSSVTAIYTEAFAWCTSLTSITIPSGVTDIGFGLLVGCSNITSITVEAGNRYYRAAGNCLIDMTGRLIAGCKNSVIPNDGSVQHIHHEAFGGLSGLTSIVIPASVTEIGDGILFGCPDLANIAVAAENEHYHAAGNCLIETESKTLKAACNNAVIPDDGSVTCIGYFTFFHSEHLTTIAIPDSVTKICEDAFADSTNLTSIILPKGLTKIEGHVFAGCTRLASVTIPSSVVSIDNQAFYDCESLAKIVFVGTPEQWEAVEKHENWDEQCGAYILRFEKEGTEGLAYTLNEDGASYTVKKGTVTGGDVTIASSYNGLPVTAIGGLAFYNCINLTSIDIPDSVTSIGGEAFNSCDRLTNVTIPDGVTSIGVAAFRNCRNLTNIVIPDSVTSIGSSAFESCTGLTSVTIGNGVKSIGQDAFAGCYSLRAVYITDIAAWCGISFDDIYANPLRNASLYLNNNLVTELVIPDGVTSIGSSAFPGCTGLTSITIPGSVTSIGADAFATCDSLTRITFKGTMAKWNAVEKGSDWDYDTDAYTVYCTDGNIAKQ